MVEPSFSDRSLIKHTDYLTNARVITSSAVNITENQVLTADGNSVSFDYLVIATGHAYSTPTSKKERLEQFQQGNYSTFFSSLDLHGHVSYLYFDSQHIRNLLQILCSFVLTVEFSFLFIVLKLLYS